MKGEEADESPMITIFERRYALVTEIPDFCYGRRKTRSRQIRRRGGFWPQAMHEPGVRLVCGFPSALVSV